MAVRIAQKNGRRRQPRQQRTHYLGVIQYVRSQYPSTETTSEIADTLGLSKRDVLDELNNSNRMKRNVGTAHGDINAAV